VSLPLCPNCDDENGHHRDDCMRAASRSADPELSCSMNAYPRINGLRAGGFFARVKDYPRMVRWLAP